MVFCQIIVLVLIICLYLIGIGKILILSSYPESIFGTHTHSLKWPMILYCHFYDSGIDANRDRDAIVNNMMEWIFKRTFEVLWHMKPGLFHLWTQSTSALASFRKWVTSGSLGSRLLRRRHIVVPLRLINSEYSAQMVFIVMAMFMLKCRKERMI